MVLPFPEGRGLGAIQEGAFQTGFHSSAVCTSGSSKSSPGNHGHLQNTFLTCLPEAHAHPTLPPSPGRPCSASSLVPPVSQSLSTAPQGSVPRGSVPRGSVPRASVPRAPLTYTHLPGLHLHSVALNSTYTDASRKFSPRRKAARGCPGGIPHWTLPDHTAGRPPKPVLVGFPVLMPPPQLLKPELSGPP